MSFNADRIPHAPCSSLPQASRGRVNEEHPCGSSFCSLFFVFCFLFSIFVLAYHKLLENARDAHKANSRNRCAAAVVGLAATDWLLSLPDVAFKRLSRSGQGHCCRSQGVFLNGGVRSVVALREPERGHRLNGVYAGLCDESPPLDLVRCCASGFEHPSSEVRVAPRWWRHAQSERERGREREGAGGSGRERVFSRVVCGDHTLFGSSGSCGGHGYPRARYSLFDIRAGSPSMLLQRFQRRWAATPSRPATTMTWRRSSTPS